MRSPHADIVVGLLGMEGMKPSSFPGLTEIMTVSRKKKMTKKVTPKLDSVLLKMDPSLFFGHSRPE